MKQFFIKWRTLPLKYDTNLRARAEKTRFQSKARPPSLRILSEADLDINPRIKVLTPIFIVFPYSQTDHRALINKILHKISAEDALRGTTSLVNIMIMMRNKNGQMPVSRTH